MSHVIRAYVDADLEPWRVRAVASYSSASRLRWLRCLIGATSTVAFTRRTSVSGIHLHVSQRLDIPRSLMLIEIARLRRIPSVVTIHGSEFMHEVRERPALAAALLRRAAAVTVLSREVETAVRTLGISNVSVLPNPTPVTAVTPVNVVGQTQVLFAGEIGRRKGVDVLLAAWPAVMSARPELSLLLVGLNVEDELLSALPPGASYGGVVSQEQVREELARSCLAVLPSRHEQMPMFILEAMAAGVPVVTTAVGASADVVGDAGVVVAPEDIDALAAAIVEVTADPERLAELGRIGRSRAEANFSAEVFAERVRGLYETAFRA